MEKEEEKDAPVLSNSNETLHITMSPNSTQFLNNKKASVESFSTNLVLQYITMGQSIVQKCMADILKLKSVKVYSSVNPFTAMISFKNDP